MMLDEVIQRFAPGDTFSLDTVTVLGPYPTPDFFESLRAHKPKKVVLYVDDGVAQSVLNNIQQLFYKKRCRFEYSRVSPETGCGLVHAKVYLFEWRNNAENQRQQTKRCVLIGSANASIQGFSSHAETFLCNKLAAKSDVSGVVKYFDRLREAGATAATSFDVDEGSRLWFPAIKVVKTTVGDTFDAWLRRGMLCHKYEPNQNFGKLWVNLKQPLPPGQEEGAFIKTGFSRESGSTRLVRPYGQNVELPKGLGNNAPLWRGKYFVETRFGFWSSEEWYQALNKEGVLVSKTHKARKTTLERISGAGDSEHQKWVGELKEHVQDAAYLLGDSAQKFLNMRRSEVDWRHYRAVADKKLKDDLRLAKDKLFSNRYISGYDFQQVPPLGEHFDGFANSFGTSLLNSMHKGNTLNKLGQRVRSLAKKDSSWLEFEDSARFIERLRSEWADIREFLTSYYQD